MAKSKSKTQRRKAKQAAATPKPVVRTRRDVLRIAGFTGAGVLAAGGAGAWALHSFRSHVAETDLTRIAQGTPCIVQVHDPSCALCNELQRNTRRALRCEFATEPTYLVANINTTEGSLFATRHGVGHVTLVLLDGEGNLEDIMSGVQPVDALKSAFEQRYGSA